MGRKKGPDLEKMEKIRKTLKEHPNSIWIRELARQSGLTKSTVHRYLTEYMQDEVEESLSVSGLVKMYKLKK